MRQRFKVIMDNPNPISTAGVAERIGDTLPEGYMVCRVSEFKKLKNEIHRLKQEKWGLVLAREKALCAVEK